MSKTLAQVIADPTLANINDSMGRLAAASSKSVALATDDSTNLAAVATAVADTTTPSPVIARSPNYETVAASQTDQVMGTSGAAGDILSYLWVVPATTSPGAVSIKDGSGSAITVFTGGASSVATLHGFSVPVGAPSASGAWKVTTGTNVSVIAYGKFS